MLSRLRAYVFIRNFVETEVPWLGHPNKPTDKQLDDLFKVPKGTFNSLKNAEIDPPEALVSAFKRLADSMWTPGAEDILITPFKT